MDSKRPPWVKIQENGAQGEATTKAFLLDGFWILERSVDAEGADLMIQRRDKKSFLSRKPPNVGYVQAKFFQDGNTTQYVHQEYVVDPEGCAWGEFFLICHTGTADESRMFFLCAKDIQDNFRIMDAGSSRPNCFAIPGRVVFDNRWEITNKKRRLDLMEQALINADFASNRRFLSWVLPDAENESILPEYVEDIEYWEEGVPRTFFKLRQQAEDEAWGLIERLDLLTTITNTHDPLVALQKACDLSYLDERRDGFYNEDYHRTILRQKEWYELLYDAGLLDKHAQLKSALKRMMIDDWVEKFPFTAGNLYLVEVSFDINNLDLGSFASRLGDQSSTHLKIHNSSGQDYGVEESPLSTVKGFAVLSNLFSPADLVSEEYDPRDKITWRVELLLQYMMFDVLDSWRYEHRGNKVI
jgi:hypothetical protein